MENLLEIHNANAAISISPHLTSCHDRPTTPETSEKMYDQFDADEPRDFAKVDKKPFHFMGLPPEIRANVFRYIYIQNIDEVPPHRRSSVRSYSFPHLACDVHLVCRLIFIEMVAFVASQPKIPVNIILPEYTTRISFDGIVTKRLLCPAIRELGLNFEHPSSPKLDWVAELVLFGVYYIQQLQPSISKLNVAVRTNGFFDWEVGALKHCIDRDGNVEIVVEMLTMKFVVQGSTASIVRPEVEQALDDFQNASNTTTKK